MVELTDQIKVVAEVRGLAKTASDNKKVAYTEWESENEEILNSATVLATAVNLAEEKLRELTLKAYAETGNKKPAEGVGIREVTILDYDPKVALDWAKSHKLALTLNKTLFESLAKTDPPGFVKINKESHATIAKDLSEYL